MTETVVVPVARILCTAHMTWDGRMRFVLKKPMRGWTHFTVDMNDPSFLSTDTEVVMAFTREADVLRPSGILRYRQSNDGVPIGPWMDRYGVPLSEEDLAAIDAAQSGL